MPTPALTDDDLALIIRVWRDHECKPKLAAEAMGMKPSTFDHRLAVAKQRGLHLSEGARHSVAAAKMIPGEVRGGHRRVYDEETGKQIDTIRWSAPQDTPTEADILERIAAAFAGIPAAPPVAPPEQVQEDLCALYPLYDVHWGMHAWGAETGGDDYDLKLAKSDLLGAFERLLFKQPPVKQAVLLIGGDFFHADDNRNVTPGHGHHLDGDGRLFKVIDTAIETLDHMIHRMQTKAESVLIRVIRGNHDEHSHTNLTFGLDGRFRDSRAQVEKTSRDLFQYQWGDTALFGQHGDKQTPKDWVGKLSDSCPTYSATPFRYAFTGHKHKFAAEMIYGTHWEQLHPFCPPDAYGATWVNRRAMKFDIFDKANGRTMTAFDPLKRKAAA